MKSAIPVPTAPEPAGDRLVWKALADPTRRAILDHLRQQPLTTGALAECFEISRYGVMKHLDVLHKAGLVLVRRRGRERWNHLNPVPIQQIHRRWMQPFAAPSADALLRLKKHAERAEITTAAEPAIQGETMTDQASRALCALDIQQEIHIAAPRQRVWQSMTENIAAWWPRDFYVGAAPLRFVVEPRVGGRVYEDWGGGEGMLWATLVVFKKEQKLQWVGDLSPDFGGPARSITTFELVAEGDATVLRFRDSPYGALADNALENMESGWRWLLNDCLKPYAEDGTQPDRPPSVIET